VILRFFRIVFYRRQYRLHKPNWPVKTEIKRIFTSLIQKIILPNKPKQFTKNIETLHGFNAPLKRLKHDKIGGKRRF